MNALRNELAHFGDEITWLTTEDAQLRFNECMQWSSCSHYGLDDAAVLNIERLNVEDCETEARDWLRERLVGTRLCVAYDRATAFESSTQFLVENSQGIFCPSRDDAFIVSEDHTWVLFYWHEDEFEYGKIGTKTKA